jgi:DNA-binding HxlR family transcriptional regulator/putative sterol carrier protein
MAPRPRYADGCAAAHALSLVGERWALLIVRELLFGPKRFTDLQTGLRGASPNALSQRLRELEHADVVRRRKLGPPTGTWVYELTEWGQDLEPVLIHLGQWGRRSRARDPNAETGIDAIMLAMKGHLRLDVIGDLEATYALLIDDERFWTSVSDKSIDVKRGEHPRADATVRTNLTTFTALVTGRRTLRQAIKGGQVTLSGNRQAVHRLFDALQG